MLRNLTRFLLILAGVAAATPVFAHATLVATDPADGAVLTVAPETLTLTFNEPVTPLVLRLVAPDGTATELGDFAVTGPAVVVELPALASGTQVLTWRAVSLDGHPIGGALVFSVGAVTGAAEVETESDPLLRPILWLARVAIYLGLFVGAAGAFFAAWIAAPAEMPRGALRVIRTFAIAGLVAIPVAFAMQGVDLLGERVTAALTGRVLRTAFGSTYAATLLVAAGALIAALITLARPVRFRWIAAGALLAIGIAFSLSGHASRAPPQALTWLVVMIHTGSVAFWIGSLVPLAFLMRDPNRNNVAALARFSAVIPHAFVPLIVTGALLMLVQLDRPSDLWATDYGRILIAKLTVVAAIAFVVWRNRYRITPMIRATPAKGAPALRRSIAVEFALVLALFGLVAGWRFTPPPRSTAAAPVPLEQIAAAAPRSFIQHFHLTNFGANIEIVPGEIGPVSVIVELMDGAYLPLEARELAVTLSNDAAGIGPIERTALRREDGKWVAEGFVLPVAGVWTLGLEALVSDFDRRSVAGPIVISDPNAPPAQPEVAAAGGHDHEHAVGPAVDVNDPLQVVVLDAADAPAIAMDARPAGDGVWNLTFTVERFRFGTPEDGFTHVPGVGHGHVLVNGQYVGDLAGPTYQLTLPSSGVFEIYVGLSALDHRSLVVDGELVSARILLLLSDRTAIADQRTVLAAPIVIGPDAPTLRVGQGDTVALNLTSTEPQVVHLHGYDLEVAIGPRSPITLLFNAAFAGRFVAEAHDVNETPVFYLEVVP